MTTISTAISQRIDSVFAEGLIPVAVFDLDATLFDNAPRNWRILWEYAVEHSHEPLRIALEKTPPYAWPYSLEEVLQFLGIQSAHGHAEIFSFWKDRFFSDRYQLFDVAAPGAQRFVSALYQQGVSIVYMSGRDAPGMYLGCVESLYRCGFPVGGVRTTVTLKAAFETDDTEFKASAVEDINRLGQVVFSVDNEPRNCNLFIEKWPQAVIARIDTHCAPNPPALYPQIHRFARFDELI